MKCLRNTQKPNRSRERGERCRGGGLGQLGFSNKIKKGLAGVKKGRLRRRTKQEIKRWLGGRRDWRGADNK